MKRLFPLLFIFIFLSPIARAQEFKTALDVNEYFSDITDSLYHSGAAWGAQLAAHLESKDLSSLTPVRITLQHFISERITSLQTMKDQYGSGDFRLSMLNYLKTEDSLVRDYFVPFEMISKTTAKEDIQKLIDNFQLTLIDKENAALDKVRTAQLLFAKANNITLENPGKD